MEELGSGSFVLGVELLVDLLLGDGHLGGGVETLSLNEAERVDSLNVALTVGCRSINTGVTVEGFSERIVVSAEDARLLVLLEDGAKGGAVLSLVLVGGLFLGGLTLAVGGDLGLSAVISSGDLDGGSVLVDLSSGHVGALVLKDGSLGLGSILVVSDELLRSLSVVLLGDDLHNLVDSLLALDLDLFVTFLGDDDDFAVFLGLGGGLDLGTIASRLDGLEDTVVLDADSGLLLATVLKGLDGGLGAVLVVGGDNLLNFAILLDLDGHSAIGVGHSSGLLL